jgi:CHASE3 domain sensor protein
MASQVGPLRTFARDLGLLRKMGLSPALLNQIANLGPQQGIQVAQQLLSGGRGTIASLDASQRAIARYSHSAAATAEDAVYAKRIAADRAEVRKQTHLLEQLVASEHRQERQAAREIARNVTIDVRGKITNEDIRAIVKGLNRLGRTTGQKIL